MAQFTLRFIVPNNDDIFSNTVESNERYIGNLITSFEDQQSIYKNNRHWTDTESSIIKSTSLTYTYNEKLSLHKHGQKELSFSMDDKVFVNNEWIQNPYARILRNGVQIELTDKYNNIYLFTVNKIQYTLKNLNIVYNVTCQDSFTYQLNRQNSGYTLTNDETSLDFIGALDIDQWSAKIVKDCYITYQYVPLDTGIYQYKDDHGHIFINTFEYPGDDKQIAENSIISLSSGYKVTKIIKNIYDKDHYEEFYETFPFSASNASANAALISLADTLCLQLCVVEGYQEQEDSGVIFYNRYFYFSPVKNTDTSGLTYSPKQEVQDFGLNFSGDSLTTVLNVQSTTWNDQEIGLFPRMPMIIQQMVMSPQWESSTFYPGYFSEAIRGKSFSDRGILDINNRSNCSIKIDEKGIKIDEKGINVDDTGVNYLKIPLDIRNEWTSYYDKIQLLWDEQYYSTFIVTLNNSRNHVLNTFGNRQDILVYFTDGDINRFYYCNENINKEDIQKYCEGTYNLYLCFRADDNDNSFDIESFYLKITRDFTEEESTFAEIADECPWLENKIIDFTYFLHQGIISRAEYENLMKWLTNDLRIINGQLMCYADAYHQALHDQTEKLAKIESDTEEIGAHFMADIEEPYQSTGDINNNVISFTESYNNLFYQLYQTDKPSALLNFNNIITQKFNQYFAAEQRFFKNIYNFKKYFNELNIYSSLYGQTYLVDGQYKMSQSGVTINGENVIFSFDDNISYKQIKTGDSIINGTGIDSFINETIYQYVNHQYIAQKIPNPKNYKEFYVPQIVEGALTEITENHTYNNENNYYMSEQSYRTLFAVEDLSYKTTITQNNDTYVLLSERELEILYASKHIEDLYVRDTELKIPFEYVRANSESIKYYLDLDLWKSGKQIINFFNSQHNGINFNVRINDEWNVVWNLYKLLIPIDNLYVKDYNINYALEQNNFSFKIYDEYNVEYRYNQQELSWQQRKNNDKDEDWEEEWENIGLNRMYQKFYSVPFLNAKDNIISNFFSSLNSTSLSMNDAIRLIKFLQTPQQTTKYFTCALSSNSDKLWTAFREHRDDDSFIAELIEAAKNNDFDNPTGWIQDSETNRSLSIIDNINSTTGKINWKTYENDDKWFNELKPFDWQEQTESYYGDNYLPNYTIAANSEKQIRYLTDAFVQSDLGGHLVAIREGPDDDIQRIVGVKHYFNYYKHIVATYSQGVSIKHINQEEITNPSKWGDLWHWRHFTENVMDKYYVKNKYGHFCNKETTINFKDTYLWVPVSNMYTTDANKQSWLPHELPDRFSLLTFYPLAEGDIVNFNTVFTAEQKKSKVNYLIGDYINSLHDNLPWSDWQETGDNVTINWEDDNTTITFSILYGTKTYRIQYRIMHVEPYEYGILSDDTTISLNDYKPNNYQVYVGTTTQPFYHKDTEKPLETEELIFTAEDGLYFIPIKDDNLVLVSSLDHPELIWNNNNTQLTHWYSTKSLDSRTYSVYQIINNSNLKYYYLHGSVLKESDICSNLQFNKEFTVKYQTYTVDVNNTLILNNKINSVAITCSIDAEHDNDIDITTQLAQQIDGFRTQSNTDGVLIQPVSTHYNVSNMTNGEFWYFFKDRLDIYDIHKKTAIIAAELTLYWQQAYNASQLCKWFLPEYWQPTTDKLGKNNFASLLYQIQDDHIILIDDLLPEVEIFKYNGQTLLPNYRFFYGYDTEVLNNNSERLPIEKVEIFSNNLTVLNCIQDIFGENDIVTAQEQGLTTYYSYIGKGWLRSEVIHNFAPDNKILSNLTGLYGMQLHILLNNYYDAGTSLYEKTLNKKLRLWKMWYSRYPGIFLENVYTNKDARSEKQLLQMAKLAFKDYSAPEKQYNITLIDAAALQGYQGQELHLGDGILLRTSDYYDEIDETYRALNQYLFISDISYDLRKDTDIALTVNTIKYQDKLLQSIVKLIR